MGLVNPNNTSATVLALLQPISHYSYWTELIISEDFYFNHQVAVKGYRMILSTETTQLDTFYRDVGSFSLRGTIREVLWLARDYFPYGVPARIDQCSYIVIVRGNCWRPRSLECFPSWRACPPELDQVYFSNRFFLYPFSTKPCL